MTSDTFKLIDKFEPLPIRIPTDKCQLEDIEQNRNIDEVTLKKYLPDTENMLPMVTGGGN